MNVTIDDREIEAEELGLETVGEVLAHVQRSNRLVVNMLIDGEAPSLDGMGTIRAASLRGKTLYIETAEPRQMALDVLQAVGEQFREADRLKNESAELLQRGDAPKALEKLGGCFTTWNHAQESVLKTAQLLRINLNVLTVDGQPLVELIRGFSGQLRQIKSALEARDFVMLADVLVYEMEGSTERWMGALAAMRKTIE